MEKWTNDPLQLVKQKKLQEIKMWEDEEYWGI